MYLCVCAQQVCSEIKAIPKASRTAEQQRLYHDAKKVLLDAPHGDATTVCIEISYKG